MEISRYYTRETIRFRRFCRKNYAVFVSLKREITIGSLCVKICDLSLVLHKKCVSAFVSMVSGVFDIAENEDDQKKELDKSQLIFALQNNSIALQKADVEPLARTRYCSYKNVFEQNSEAFFRFFISTKKIFINQFINQIFKNN